MGLVKRGHEVTVYSPSYHPYKDDEYKGVKIKHIYSIVLRLGWVVVSVLSFTTLCR